MRLKELLIKSIIDGLSDQEVEEFHELSKDHPMYKELYDRFQTRDMHSLYKAYGNLDDSGAWNDLEKLRKKSQKKSKLFRIKLAVIAATILIAAISTLIIRTIPSEKESTTPLLVDNQSKTVVVVDGCSYAITDAEEIAYYEKSAAKNESVKSLEVIVGQRETFNISLPDGSTVHLNAMSRIKYPIQFDDEKREVEFSGEAYFDIKKDPKNPFVIKCREYNVQVLGTSFNLNNYANDSTSKVTLISGKLNITAPTYACTLTPNMEATINKTNNEINVKEVDASKSILWIDNVLTFKKTSLVEITQKLSRWYGVRFVFKNNQERTFSGECPLYEDINKVLNLLELTTDIDFVLKDSTVTVN